MPESLTIHRVDVHITMPVGWFHQLDELRPVGPGEVANSDVWTIEEDNEPVAMALVEASRNHVHRLGVLPDYRNNGLASTLIDRLYEEYGALKLECRKSLSANEFYDATGWEQTGVAVGDPEDLVCWKYDPDG